MKLTDLQFAVLHLYSDTSEYEGLQETFLNIGHIIGYIKKEPEYFDVDISEIKDAIDYVHEKRLIESNGTANFHKISRAGTLVYWQERVEREIKKNDEKLSRLSLQTSITSNRWSPIWAGLAALFALASVGISWFSYRESSKERITPAILQIDKTLKEQSKIQEYLLQETKSVQLELYRLVDSLYKAK